MTKCAGCRPKNSTEKAPTEWEYLIGRLDPDGKLEFVYVEEIFISKEDAVRNAAFSMGEVVVARPAPEPYVIVSYGDETEIYNA